MHVKWAREMSGMSAMLILSNRLKVVTNSCAYNIHEVLRSHQKLLSSSFYKDSQLIFHWLHYLFINCYHLLSAAWYLPGGYLLTDFQEFPVCIKWPHWLKLWQLNMLSLCITHIMSYPQLARDMITYLDYLPQ